MTDYWKSYAKKFCEICKCWYADNKISIERHELGARHKVMVQQRLREGAKKAREKEAADHDLQMTLLTMEQAARASMLHDDPQNLPLIKDKSRKQFLLLKPEEQEGPDPKEQLKEQKRKLKELKRTAKQSQFWTDADEKQRETLDEVTGGIEWVQARTEQGTLYYWHIFTGETCWDRPVSFYTAEEYEADYAKIAMKAGGQADDVFGAYYDPTVYGQPSSSLTLGGPIEDASGRYVEMYSHMIAPQSLPQIELTAAKNNYQQHEENEREYILDKKERKRIKRERKAMAQSEGLPQVPEGLVELKPELKIEQPEPELVSINIQDREEERDQIRNHPLGPWIPVKKDSQLPIPENDAEMERTAKRKYDDLPEQEYGPGSVIMAQTPAELLEIAEMEPDDLNFKQKQLPTEKKKSTKIVGFRKPAGGGGSLTSKSLRNKK